MAVMSQLEGVLIERRQAEDWMGVYDLLESALSSDDPLIRGWGKMQLSITEIAQSPIAARTALGHAEEALSLLDGDAKTTARALVQATYCARQIEDVERCRHYTQRMLVMMAQPGSPAAPWFGRFLTWCAYHAEDDGRLKQAEDYIRKAIRFHRDNIGPFNSETDQRCQLRMGLAALAKLTWITGRREEAIGHLREALRLASDNRRGDLAYLQGCMAVVDGQNDMAVGHFARSLEEATRAKDYLLAEKAVELMATALDATGDHASAKVFLQPHIENAARGGLDRLLNRLQRIAYRRSQ